MASIARRPFLISAKSICLRAFASQRILYIGSASASSLTITGICAPYQPYRPRGSKPQSPATYDLSTTLPSGFIVTPVAVRPYTWSRVDTSTAAIARKVSSRNGATSPRPPLSTESERPCVTSSLYGMLSRLLRPPCHSSASGQPAAASIARRQCFNSASRIHIRLLIGSWVLGPKMKSVSLVSNSPKRSENLTPSLYLVT
mmetsp:Transcript_76758/g.185461  ORF Transcript_76758/g.185461 Transcript_76758/m.185461 type:complete len:201 (+) Transcript_76758:125-727(+)